MEAGIEAPAAGLGAETEVWSTVLARAATLVPPRDQFGRTPSERRDDYTWLLKTRPTFKRGRDRWSDFAAHFTHAKEVLQVPDEEAKPASDSRARPGHRDLQPGHLQSVPEPPRKTVCPSRRRGR